MQSQPGGALVRAKEDIIIMPRVLWPGLCRRRRQHQQQKQQQQLPRNQRQAQNLQQLPENMQWEKSTQQKTMAMAMAMAMTMSTSITLVLQCERAVGKKSVHIYRRWHEICHLARMALSKQSPLFCLLLPVSVSVCVCKCPSLCTTVYHCARVCACN